MVIYLGHVWPFNEPIFTHLELLNEVTSVFLLYHALIFTDWVPQPDVRYLMGWSFIAVTCLNLVTHFILLISDTYLNSSRSLKKKIGKLKVKKALKERKVRRKEDERVR